MKLIWCSGFPKMYAWLDEGVGSVCHGYMCILLYMKLLWCSGFSEIYAWLEEGDGVNLPWVYVQCAIYETLSGVVVFQRCMLNWRRGWGQSVMSICAFCYIWNFFGVVVFKRCMLSWRRGGGVSLPWVYVHSAICGSDVVSWFSRDLCLIGVGMLASGICAFHYMWNFMLCSSIA